MSGVAVTFTRRNFAALAQYLENERRDAIRTADSFDGSGDRVHVEICEQARAKLVMLNCILSDVLEEEVEDGVTV